MPFLYPNWLVTSRHQSPCNGPTIIILSNPTKPPRHAIHAPQLSATRAIVAYGREPRRLSPAQRESRRGAASDVGVLRRRPHGRRRERPRGLRVRRFSRGSFGARLRRRWPQYGHSVIYGLTSDPHCLQTTNRSALEDIVDPF